MIVTTEQQLQKHFLEMGNGSSIFFLKAWAQGSHSLKAYVLV